jgi:hypothetical protein
MAAGFGQRCGSSKRGNSNAFQFVGQRVACRPAPHHLLPLSYYLAVINDVEMKRDLASRVIIHLNQNTGQVVSIGAFLGTERSSRIPDCGPDSGVFNPVLHYLTGVQVP